MARKKEPSRLKRGKRFHRETQADYEATADGKVRSEKPIIKNSGRGGRIDIHVDAGEDLSAVIELKATDWDMMSVSAVRRNVRRQIRQIWEYVHSELKGRKDICPGVIFPRRPEDRERLHLIEEMFNEEGIQVVWQDETIQQRRVRSDQETAE